MYYMPLFGKTRTASISCILPNAFLLSKRHVCWDTKFKEFLCYLFNHTNITVTRWYSKILLFIPLFQSIVFML